jgi:hypothetical protein
MANNLSATTNSPTKTRGLRGKAAPIGIVLATKAFTLVALLAVYYVIAFFTAVRVVPMVMGFVKSGTGVTLDMPVETVLSVWIVPALFLVALVFVLVLVAMRAIWRLRARVIIAVSRWALGEETDEETGTAVTAPLRTKRSRNQKTTSTKAA